MNTSRFPSPLASPAQSPAGGARRPGLERRRVPHEEERLPGLVHAHPTADLLAPGVGARVEDRDDGHIGGPERRPGVQP